MLWKQLEKLLPPKNILRLGLISGVSATALAFMTKEEESRKIFRRV
jgi:hypothetical protein